MMGSRKMTATNNLGDKQMKITKITSIAVAVALMTSTAGYADTFDPTTNQLSIPTITIGANTYTNVVITVGSVVSVGSSTAATGGSCTLTYQDFQGNMTLTFTKVNRVDPNLPTSAPQSYYKMIGQVVSGTPFFCSNILTAVQGGRQLSSSAFNLRSDTTGADSGYSSCATFQPGTQTILYQSVASITSSASWFSPASAFNLTMTPSGGSAVTTSCSL